MTDLHHLVQWLTKQGQPAAARAVQILADVADMPCQKYHFEGFPTTRGGHFLTCDGNVNICIPCKVRKQLEESIMEEGQSKHGKVTDWAKCRSCAAAIWWVLTPKGKRMPVNPATDDSHFATCPQANNWRKEKAPAG